MEEAFTEMCRGSVCLEWVGKELKEKLVKMIDGGERGLCRHEEAVRLVQQWNCRYGREIQRELQRQVERKQEEVAELRGDIEIMERELKKLDSGRVWLKGEEARSRHWCVNGMK